MRSMVMGATLLLLVACGCGGKRGSLETQKDRVSYAVGVEMSRDIKREHVEVDPNLVAKGLQDGLAGKSLLLSDTELRDTVAAFNTARKETAKAAADDARKRGEAFLAENAKRAGVTTLPSGLQYEVLKTGNEGRPPTDSDVAVCHYRGTLIDGTEFDTSYGRPVPFAFRVGTVIPGWREALHLMRAGSKWRLFIPPQLAYGEQGTKPKSGRVIPPNATLVFDLELLGVRQAVPGKQETASSGTAPVAE
jgi:FKBP-type peptidyl-prolyl cis-trans isomerases 1